MAIIYFGLIVAASVAGWWLGGRLKSGYSRAIARCTLLALLWAPAIITDGHGLAPTPALKAIVQWLLDREPEDEIVIIVIPTVATWVLFLALYGVGKLLIKLLKRDTRASSSLE